MSTRYANMGETGLPSLGYTFKDADEVSIGSRVTTGITELSGGWYKAIMTIPLNAESVWWDDLVVTNAVAREYFGAPVSVPEEPSTADMCVISGYLRDQRTGRLLFGVKLTAKRKPGGKAMIGGAYVVGDERSAISDATGLVQLEVEKNDEITPTGSQWRITCQPAGIDFKRAFTEDSFDLADAINLGPP